MKWMALTRLGMFTSVLLTDATTAAPSSTWVQYHKTPLAQFFPELQHIQHTLTMWIQTQACLSINIVVSHVWDRCVGTIPVIPHSTCVFYHTYHHRPLHTGGMCPAGWIDTWSFVEWTFRFQHVDTALAIHTAITNKIPDGGTSVRVRKNSLHVCVYLRQWG